MVLGICLSLSPTCLWMNHLRIIGLESGGIRHYHYTGTAIMPVGSQLSSECGICMHQNTQCRTEAERTPAEPRQYQGQIAGLVGGTTAMQCNALTQSFTERKHFPPLSP